MKKINRNNKSLKNIKDLTNTDRKIIKWRIGLISLSLKESEPNVAKFSNEGQSGMVADIIDYFKNSDPINETYIFLVRIFQYTADIDKGLAEKYRKLQVGEPLINNIRDKLILYMQFRYLSTDEAIENDKTLEEKQLEFKILACQIDCLKELGKAKLSNTDEFLADVIHEEILAVLSLEIVDPILLISCCNYATEYFTERNVITDSKILSRKLQKIDSGLKLLPYLGGSNYERTLEK